MGGDNVESLERQPGKRKQRLKRRKAFRLFLIVVVIGIAVGADSFAAITTLQVNHRITKFGLNNVGELVTQTGYFTVVSVMDDSARRWGWSIPLTDSKYVFSYDGIVRAGLNFEKLKVFGNELLKEVKIYLPKIEILGIEILEDSLEIYDERHNIFTPLGLEDIQAARLSMIDKIEETAKKRGLFEQAKENAETLITGLLEQTYNPQVYKYIFAAQ